MHDRSHFSPPFHRLLTSLFTFVLVLFNSSPAHAQTPSLTDKVVVLPITEFSLVEATRIEHLLKSLEKAKAESAAAVVLEIDSRGGLAIATRRVVEKLGAMGGVKTCAYIKGEAVGGPALIALATDKIYFAPNVRMGATQEQEIEWRGKKEDLPDRLIEKTYADFADVMKNVITAKGRDGNLLDGFLDKSLEIKAGEQVLSEADDVLILDAESPISDGAAKDIEELIALAELRGASQRLEYSHPVSAEKEASASQPEKPGTPPEELAFGKSEEESYTGKVVVIEIGQSTLMRKSKFDFMNRILDKAVADGAEAIILEMDTPGGQLWASEDLMYKLEETSVPTFTFVNTAASSAGSMIAISTDKIYMHDPSTIGSAAIVSGGKGIDGTMREKVERKFLDSVERIAEKKGRDPDLCMAFVRPELEYSKYMPVVLSDGSLSSQVAFFVKKDELLSLNSKEAIQMIDGKPLLAEGYAQSIEDLMEKEGLQGDVVRAKPLGFERVADVIVMLAPLLLMVALAGLYMEANSPGFGVPGAVALLVLAIFFFGHQAAGKLAGYEVIGVFLLGIGLLIVELFILPGVFIFGAIGLLLIIGSLLFAMIDKFDFGKLGGDFDFGQLPGAMGTPVMNLLIGMIGAGILILVLIRYLPAVSFVKRRMLAGVISGDMSGAGAPAGMGMEDLVGLEGTANCDLRPTGSGKFGGRMLDVTTDSEFLPTGTPVKIVRNEGMRIVVEKI